MAAGGEYGAGHKTVGRGRLVTLFLPEKEANPVIVDGRMLRDEVCQFFWVLPPGAGSKDLK